jgi:uncharacterized protein (TIGR02284 family)
MYNRRQVILRTLERLIQTCRNCERAFSTAGDGVTDGSLREIFGAYAAQRAHFAAELAGELKHWAAESGEEGESCPQAFRRPWVRIRSAVGRDGEEALLAECEQGEHAALESYKEALATQLPEYLYVLVRRQYLEVQAARNHLVSLERCLAGCTSTRSIPGHEIGGCGEGITPIPRFSLSSEAVGNYLR